MNRKKIKVIVITIIILTFLSFFVRAFQTMFITQPMTILVASYHDKQVIINAKTDNRVLLYEIYAGENKQWQLKSPWLDNQSAARLIQELNQKGYPYIPFLPTDLIIINLKRATNLGYTYGPYQKNDLVWGIQSLYDVQTQKVAYELLIDETNLSYQYQVTFTEFNASHQAKKFFIEIVNHYKKIPSKLKA